MTGIFYLYNITTHFRHFLPKSDSVLIGRSSTTDLTLDNPSVSNKHAIISVRESSVYLRDLESTNGTFVNGEKLSKSDLKEVQAGDIIRFGFDPNSWRLEKTDSKTDFEKFDLKNEINSSPRGLSSGDGLGVGLGSIPSSTQSNLGLGGGLDTGITNEFTNRSRLSSGLGEIDSQPSRISRLQTSKYQSSRLDSNDSPINPPSKKSSASESNDEFEIWKSTTEHLDRLEQRVGYLEDTALTHKDIDHQLKRQQVTLLANVRHLAHDLSMKLSNYTISAKVKPATTVKEMLEQIESDLMLCSTKSSELITIINDLRSENRTLHNQVEEINEANSNLIKESKRNESLEELEIESLRSEKRDLERKLIDLESKFDLKNIEISELKEKLSTIDEKSGRRYHLLDVQNIELKKSNEDLRQELKSTHEYLSSVHSQLVESKSPRPKDRRSLSSANQNSPISIHSESIPLIYSNQDYVDYLRSKLEERENEVTNLKRKLNRVSLAVEDEPL